MRQLLLPKDYNDEGILTLDKDTSSYLAKVLRLKIGDKFKGINRNGEDYTLTVKEINKKEVIVRCMKGYDSILKESQPNIITYPNLSLAIANLKGKKLDLVVREATEIGVNSIYIFEGKNSISTYKKDNKIERLEKIRDEAIQQCGSRNITKINQVKLVDILKLKANFIVLHQDLEETPLLKSVVSSLDKSLETIVFIGPEGGFDSLEIELFKNANSHFNLLPTNILRSETACIYALSCLQQELSY